MKYILLVLTILLSATTGYAVSKINTDIILPKGSVQTLYSDVLSTHKLNVVKLVDGGTTCYISFATYGGNTNFTSIDCK